MNTDAPPKHDSTTETCLSSADFVLEWHDQKYVGLNVSLEHKSSHK